MHIEYEDGTSAEVVSDSGWKLTTDGPIRANNEYDGEEYDARKEMPGWSAPGFDDRAMAARAGRDRAGRRAGGADDRPDPRHADAQADRRHPAEARRVDLRHGPEHGGLVPAQGVRPARDASLAAPRRDAQARRHAVPGQHPLGEGDGHLHAQGQGHGDLRAALHLSRLSLRRGDRLSGQAELGARGAGGAR